MEILIIGGILVALMVLVSTSIKRSAARAFEPEVITSEGFRIAKSEGFLHPLRDESEFAFEAYSKLFGERTARNVWRARARVRITEGRNIEGILASVSREETVLSQMPPESDKDGKVVATLESERTEDDQRYLVKRKLIEGADGKRTFELKMTLLADYAGEYASRVDQMIESFEVFDS